jgi:hypothetical protein
MVEISLVRLGECDLEAYRFCQAGPVMNSPAPPPEPDGSSGATRRRFLAAGAAAVVVGAGAGTVAEWLRRSPVTSGIPHPPPPPADLVAAAATEARLIADLDATTGGPPEIRRIIRAARADHAAHLDTLRQLLSAYSPAPGAALRPGRGSVRTLTQLRTAETSAAVAANRRASGQTGALAALFASIAASESTHAALLR